MPTTEHRTSDREPQLLREVHEALDTLEHDLNELQQLGRWLPPRLMDQVVTFRREFIQAFREPLSK